MKIIVDAMGGDNAPGEIVRGAVKAAAELDVDIILVGRGEEILEILHEGGAKNLPKGIEIAHASQVVEMCDDPMSVMRDRKDSSLVTGMKLLGDGAGDAFVSAGSTGALITTSTLIVKRIKGIRRAALSPIIPTEKGGALLIDCGANAECTPEHLLQFAYMGSYYMEQALGLTEPRIGLLNIGTEETKGLDLQRQTYALLTQAHKQKRMNFIGNIEAREVLLGGADVVVTDGFSGNILLKAMEGTGIFFTSELKRIFTKNLMTKLAALIVQKEIKAFKKSIDYREVGGTVLLGISKPVIKAHGSSDAKAIFSAIRQAKNYALAGIAQEILENIDFMKGAE